MYRRSIVLLQLGTLRNEGIAHSSGFERRTERPLSMYAQATAGYCHEFDKNQRFMRKNSVDAQNYKQLQRVLLREARRGLGMKD